MLAPVPAGAIWICAPQPLPSKPQQEGMLSALLPGSSTRSQSFYRLQGLHFKLIFHMHPVFALFCCALLQVCACEEDEGLCAIKTLLVCHGGVGGSFLLTLQPSSAHPRIFGWRFIPFIERVLGDGFGKRIRKRLKR